MNKVKVAVIGLKVGKIHIMDYIKDERISEIIICDINEEKMNEVGDEFGLNKRYTDYNKMLEEEKPDIVSVCVSNFLHNKICKDVLRKGAHVLCEKPLARTADEGREIIDVANECGKKLMVNFNRRYNKESVALKKLIDEGELGEIYYATTSWKRSRGVPWWYPLNNTKEKCGGGAFIDLGVHMLDLCLWLCGYPKAKCVFGKTFQGVSRKTAIEKGFENFDAEDMGVAMISMENGMMIETEISWASNCELEYDQVEVRLYGNKGGAVIKGRPSLLEKALIIRDDNGSTKVSEIELKEATENIRSSFVSAVINNTPVPCPPEQGVMVSEIIDALYASSEKNQPVTF